MIADDVALFLPLHYEPGYAYPLLMWVGEAESSADSAATDGTTLRDIMPQLSLRNFIGASIPLGDGDEPGTSGRGKLAERIDRAIISVRERYRIHASRIFLGGRGEGGTAALRLAFAAPADYAGVLSLGGPFPPHERLLTGLDALRALPIFVGTWCGLPPERREAIDEDLVLAATAGLQLVHVVEPRDTPSARPLQSVLRAAHHWMMDIVNRPT